MEIGAILDWFKNNTNHPISEDVIDHILEKEILKDDKNFFESLKALMLESFGDKFVIDGKGKYVVKKNKHRFIESFNKTEIKEPKKVNNAPFKLKLIRGFGNEIKLIKA